MRVYLFALSMCLLVAASGCKSNSANSQQAATPGQSSQQQQGATVTTTGATVETGTAAAPQNASPQTPGNPATVPGQTATTVAALSVASASDACALLTSDEIKSVQGEAIKESKASSSSDARFVNTQCFYTTPTFTKSISLGVMRKGAGGQSVREFWRERFENASEKGERESERERERERERRKGGAERKGEEEEEGVPPRRVPGVGDEAYWVSSPVNGTMYVLKKDAIIRISIGGQDDDATRLKKSKTLAGKALSRL
jgi:hypothetical protein